MQRRSRRGHAGADGGESQTHHPPPHLRLGGLGSVAELIDAIEDYVAHHNDNRKPFVWTKTAEESLAKVRPDRVALEQARVV